MKENHSKKKIMISVLMLVILLMSLSVNTFAAVIEQPGISPLWVNISSINLDMAFDGDEGTASGTTRKSPNATFIEATIYIYRWEDGRWVYMDASYGSKTIGTLLVSVDFTCEAGVEYKTEMRVTAYENDIIETETVEYIERCPG